MSANVDAPRTCSIQLGKQFLPSFLDFAWSVSADRSMRATPLTLNVIVLSAYLSPKGAMPAGAQGITMNGQPQIPGFGNPSFDLTSAPGTLTGTTLDSSSSIVCALAIEGSLNADDWRDLCLLLDYGVAE
jgi:hypothetical protein